MMKFIILLNTTRNFVIIHSSVRALSKLSSVRLHRLHIFYSDGGGGDKTKIKIIKVILPPLYEFLN